MLKSVYDPNEDGVIAVAQTEADMKASVYQPQLAAVQALLAAHKTQHQNGGTDEINATGLTGVPVAPLLVDGVAGRVLRLIYFYLTDGTNVDTIKCNAFDVWNGDAIAAVDNIGRGATVGVFTLEADGQKLIIDSDAFSGNIKFSMVQIVRGDPTTYPTVYPEKYGNDLRLHFYEHGTATSIDIVAAIGLGQIRMLIAYITDA